MNTLRLATCALVLTFTGLYPSTAGILYTGTAGTQFFLQDGLSSNTPDGAGIFFDVSVQSPTDFTDVRMDYSGPGSPEVLPYHPKLIFNGAYEIGVFHYFDSYSALNAAYPDGTYLFTATNGITAAVQTASAVYTSGHWPSVTPALTTSSFNALQGMDTSQAQTLHFNSFTADGSNASGDGIIDPATQIYIYDSFTGQQVYVSPQLQDSTTSYVLPARTLDPGRAYFYTVSFYNSDHLPGHPGYFLDHYYQTQGLFTTAVGPPAPKTLANLQGGTPSNPVLLPIVGQIGDVTGSIGGENSIDFYQFYWSGGAFEATMSLNGAEPADSFEYQLLDRFGSLIAGVTLDHSNGFTATINELLGSGLFEIGIIADNSNDPQYHLSFVTPVQGIVPAAASVPEPASVLILAGAFGIVARRKRRAKSRGPVGP